MDTSLDLIPSQDDMKIDLMELEMQQRAFTLELSMKRVNKQLLLTITHFNV